MSLLRRFKNECIEHTQKVYKSFTFTIGESMRKDLIARVLTLNNPKPTTPNKVTPATLTMQLVCNFYNKKFQTFYEYIKKKRKSSQNDLFFRPFFLFWEYYWGKQCHLIKITVSCLQVVESIEELNNLLLTLPHYVPLATNPATRIFIAAPKSPKFIKVKIGTETITMITNPPNVIDMLLKFGRVVNKLSKTNNRLTSDHLKLLLLNCPILLLPSIHGIDWFFDLDIFENVTDPLRELQCIVYGVQAVNSFLLKLGMTSPHPMNYIFQGNDDIYKLFNIQKELQAGDSTSLEWIVLKDGIQFEPPAVVHKLYNYNSSLVVLDN